MNISITIIEDKVDERERLIEALHNWECRKNVTLQINYFCNGENYFNSYKTDESNLYILDIQLKGMDGIQIAQKMRERGYKGILLFLSAFQEYVFQGYDVHALQYLLKPAVQEKLDKCLDDVQDQLTCDYFIFRNGSDKLQIPYNDIIRQTLKNILPFLPHYFVQCHRSYIVNVRYVTSIGTDRIYLPNHKIALLGRNYIDSFRHEYAQFTSRLF